MELKNRQRYSPLVEVQMAELAGETTYRETAQFIKAWTPVEMSHQTVKNILTNQSLSKFWEEVQSHTANESS